MSEHSTPLAPQAPEALAALRAHIDAEIHHLGNGLPALLRGLEGDAKHALDAILERYSRLGHLLTRLENTLEAVIAHDKQATDTTPATITLTAQETK